MLLNKYIPGLAFLILIVTGGCIEPYMPKISDSTGDSYIISGEVTDHEGFQYITVSRPSPINHPEDIPVIGCKIIIQDDKGNSYPAEEFQNGEYRAWMNQQDLQPGTSYSLYVITASGEEIRSDPDEMFNGPPLDSVYYERQKLSTNNPEYFINGIQFYADLEGTNADSRFFRWDIDETWEYHAQYPLEYYYDGKIEHVDPPDYSNKVCWSTERVRGVYTLSTKNLSSNSFKKIPLHFVDNSTTTLYFGYSILVKQHALSELAYSYWEQLRINTEETGGLYEHQPLSVVGNLKNITYPDHKVLGYFGASSVAQKRIFVEAVRDMDIYYDTTCGPILLGKFGWREYPPSTYPVYVIYLNHRSLRIVEKECVICTVLGGTNKKPDFWKW